MSEYLLSKAIDKASTKHAAMTRRELLAELDVNPILASADRVVALDALVVTGTDR